jgi:hypothetical protein
MFYLAFFLFGILNQKKKKAVPAAQPYIPVSPARPVVTAKPIAPVATPPATPIPSGKPTPEEALERLKKLFDSGLITQEEYDLRRNNILDKFFG